MSYPRVKLFINFKIITFYRIKIYTTFEIRNEDDQKKLDSEKI